MEADPRFDAELAADGVGPDPLGLFKKVVVADDLAADRGPGSTPGRGWHGFDAWMAVSPSPSRSSSTSRATPTSAAARRSCSGSPCRRTSPRRTWRATCADLLAALAHSLSSLAARLPVHPAGRLTGQAARTYRNLLLTMALGASGTARPGTSVVWGAFQGAGPAGAALAVGERSPAPARDPFAVCVPGRLAR